MTLLLVLFPCMPFSPAEIDPDFASERDAARANGFATALIDHTRVVRGDAVEAVRGVPSGHGAAVYRGWMLRPEQYEALYAALEAKGVVLQSSPVAYRICHYLPESYPFIEGHTPASVWLPLDSSRSLERETLARLLAPFGDEALIVKDYVKSQKHYWKEACYIPSASDLDAVLLVARRFLELQDDELNVGLVFRKLVPFEIVGTHPKSGMPLAAEFRIFWKGGEVLLSHRYWGDLTTFDMELPLDELRRIAAGIPSPFFTMDVALLRTGGFTVVELGDGQVAGLPDQTLAPAFYSRMKELESIAPCER